MYLMRRAIVRKRSLYDFVMRCVHDWYAAMVCKVNYTVNSAEDSLIPLASTFINLSGTDEIDWAAKRAVNLKNL